MKKNYISPEMTVRTFSNVIDTANNNLQGTSAVVQAREYLLTVERPVIQEVLVMEK
ncbi:MAG: hypothetical protein Q4G33_14465 [bacterium]|nr:hypothetical protein [bacterium]